MMAWLQCINNDSDVKPSYDLDFTNEVNDSQTSFINDMFPKGDHEECYPEQTEAIKPTYDDDQIDSNIVFDDLDVEDIDNEILREEIVRILKESKGVQEILLKRLVIINHDFQRSKRCNSVKRPKSASSKLKKSVLFSTKSRCTYESMKNVETYVQTNNRAKIALFTSLIAAKTKFLDATPIVVKTSCVVTTPLAARNKISSSTPQTPDSKKASTPTCSLPHTDFKVEALVQKLIDEDKGRQNAILDLALQFENSCTVKDGLRNAYEKCTNISQESRALIDTFLKEGFDKDYELILSMYGKAAKLEKQMDAKLAWLL
ncbi:hypothetical protein Tco_0930938 [Tanacetum coccineum]